MNQQSFPSAPVVMALSSHTAAPLTGIDGSAVSRRLLDTHPFAWLLMLGSVLRSARLIPSAAGGLGLVCAIVQGPDLSGSRRCTRTGAPDRPIPSDVEGLIGALARQIAPDVTGALTANLGRDTGDHLVTIVLDVLVARLLIKDLTGTTELRSTV